MPTRTITTRHPIDLARTLFPLRHGPEDPTIRIDRDEAIRATRTPDGPATIRLRSRGCMIEAEAWGPGTDWALERAAGVAGAEDDEDAFVPRHPVLVETRRRLPGLRLTRSAAVVETLVPAILEQKVAGLVARRAYRRMIRAVGEPAPGALGLLLPPDPARLGALGYFAFHPWGVERRRADTIRRVCALAVRLEALVDGSPSEAHRGLAAIPGIGPWTVAEVTRTALGDPDAVSVGDYHLPNLVGWALAREPRADDERMLELLEPYGGQRGRVQRLLEASGMGPPRFGPRMDVFAIERL